MALNTLICYADKDKDMFNQLMKHLVPLQREGLIDIRSNDDITAGNDPDKAIYRYLNMAQIILLLASQDFIVDNYWHNIVTRRAMERHGSGKAIVIPVILRACDWERTSFGRLKALPDDGIPIKSSIRRNPGWHSQKEAYHDVTEGIRKVIENSVTSKLPAAPSPSLPQPRRSERRLFAPVLVLFALFLLARTILFYSQVLTYSCSFNNPALGVSTSDSSSECIGISGGDTIFDTTRADGSLKEEAAVKLRLGDSSGAEQVLEQAVANDPNDAEARIYLEDLLVLASGKQYVTFVAATMLGTSYMSEARGDLQGAYMAQQCNNVVNDSKDFPSAQLDNSCTKPSVVLPDGILVRVLIANSGNDTSHASNIAQQIETLKQDNTFVGVMGWPTSPGALSAYAILSEAGIPMISQSASSNDLTGKPYFFRVAPSDQSEVAVGATYAYQQLGVRKVVIFYDPGDSSSRSQKVTFSNQFHKLTGDPNIPAEQYTTDSAGSTNLAELEHLLNNAFKNDCPDALYFAGTAENARILFQGLQAVTLCPQVYVLGENALYNLAGSEDESYPPNSRGHLYFTAYAYHSEWSYRHLPEPAFVSTDYPGTFDFGDPGHNKCIDGSYGCYIPSVHDIMAYDASITLLKGCSLAISLSPQALCAPDTLSAQLANIEGQNSVPGVSGQITLGPDGNPVNKAIVMLYVDNSGKTQIAGMKCQFLPGDLPNCN